MSERGDRLCVMGPSLWMAVFVLAMPRFLWAQQARDRDYSAGSWHAKTGGFVSAKGSPKGEERSKVHPALLRRFNEAGPEGRVKAWVLFEQTKAFGDSRAREAAISELARTYNPRAIRRRLRRRTLPGLFDLHDLPVPQHYIDAVAATGAKVHVVSRWVNGVSVSAAIGQIRDMNDLPFVKLIQPVRRGRKPVPTQPWRRKERSRGSGPLPSQAPGSTASTAGTFYGDAEEQLAQINLIAVHNQGNTGAGVIVGILDTGFRRTHEAFNEPGHPVSVVAERDFVNNDDNTGIEEGDDPSQHGHGTAILGVLGAYKPNVLVGGAYDASFILCKTEDITDEYPAEEDNYVAGLEFIEQHGGDMATASLGYIDWYTQDDLDGLTAVTAIGVNIATGNGVHCCNAAGNGGHDTDPNTSRLIAPADALEVITCGAVDSTGTIASFSSDGPTADGRVKPEVLARGLNTRTVKSYDDTGVTGGSGTSLSTPVVASAVACLIQAHPDWTVQQMRRYLTRTADYYVANGTFDPTYVRGYGIIDAAAALAGDCNGNLIDDATDIASRASFDCNKNGIPDECDISDGTVDDADNDGIPDQCALIPTVSAWGLAVMTLLLLTAGTLVIGRARPCRSSRVSSA